MFIIPCKFDTEKPYIFECVAAIKEFHPDDKIVVVDSDSSDISYYYDIASDNTVVYDAHNVNYGTNAYSIGFESRPDENYYYCIYDSLILQDNISYLEEYAVTAFRYFKTPHTGWGFDEKGENLALWAMANMMDKTHIPTTKMNKFHGVFGPMFVASNKVMRELSGVGIFEIKPENKWQLCAMERIYGIALEYLGYDFWTHAPQGEMWDFFGGFPEDKVKKINAARM
jgi:hypothetical protein